MNIKRITSLVIAAFLVCIVIAASLFRSKNADDLDVTAVNDIVQSLSEQWNQIKAGESLPCLQYGLDYVVLDSDDKRIAATRHGLNQEIASAMRNRDTIVDITVDGRTVGKCILYNNTKELWREYRDSLLIFTATVLFISALFTILFIFYIDRIIFLPFRKLQAFALHVAQGNLDMPLEMDKGNLFGAFTESFDLMREELKKARENERSANQSKKELVASLSHDIKTPVASIKAVSEIMNFKSKNEEEKRQLEIINSKADQINTLITNMFNATLEELQELSVNVNEQSSAVLYGLIENADYNKRTTVFSIPECLIVADTLRLSQVIDNIISNSYKYADTSIHIAAEIKGKFLELKFADYGTGVHPDELPLLFNKFYRAKNTEGKSGSGLGLYISKFLIEKMSGEISCRNTADGFAVILKLKIV